MNTLRCEYDCEICGPVEHIPISSDEAHCGCVEPKCCSCDCHDDSEAYEGEWT